ncbi:MAG TPA: AAA family ATPase [Trebonia sp.]
MALFVISGIPASGKSTVARLLAQRLDRAVYVPGDTIRAMVVSGRADMAADAGDAQLDQLVLRYQGALALAGVYLNAGFDVIVEDVIIGQVLRRFLPLVPVPEMHLVFLDPSGDAVAERDRDRSKTAYGENWNVRQLRDVLHMETARIGLWLDSTGLTAEETADRILGDLNASKVIVSRPFTPDVRRRRRFGPPT